MTEPISAHPVATPMSRPQTRLYLKENNAMTVTHTTDTADLAGRACEAYAAAQAQAAHRQMLQHREQVENIYRALAKLGITPTDKTPAFVNAASGRICVPLIAGELRVETTDDGDDYPIQTHTVAAEWDGDERMVRLVADLDYDDYGFKNDGRWLYPAGYLHTLADLGEALDRGGRKPAPPTASASCQVERVLQRGLTSEFLDEHDNVILTAAEAVCAALADIAAAIRAGNGL